MVSCSRVPRWSPLAATHGVPVWLDAAQAVGHVAVPRGAAAVYATSRKWLTGPRGVGMLAVAPEHRHTLRLRRLAKHPDLPDVQHLESDEAHVAGRVGLGVALREHLALGPRARARAAAGRRPARARQPWTSLAGWEVVHPEAPAGSTTALVPTAGQDVGDGPGTAARRAPRAHQRLPAVAGAAGDGSPRACVGPYLRLSPHVDLTEESVERVCQALASV